MDITCVGSYCGASLILELSVPTVQKLVSVDMIAHANRDTPKVISQNVEKYNTHGATFHQVTGDSRSQSVVSRVHGASCVSTLTLAVVHSNFACTQIFSLDIAWIFFS